MNNVELFSKAFNHPATYLAQAPGRLEILGNHTDYNEGFVLSCAINCQTEISFRAIQGARCRITSPAMNDGIREFELDELQSPLPAKDWTNYLRGVVLEFQRLGHSIGAFEALISSDVPLSAGMSSSAALEMACVTGLCELFDIKLALRDKARIGQACEHNTIGAMTGLMDQLTSLAGKEAHLVLSEYRDISIDFCPLPAEYLFVVVDSGVTHDLSCEYNERREQCESALAELQKVDPSLSALRDVTHDFLGAQRSRLDEVVYRRALHIVGENHRVHQAQKHLADFQLQPFGDLLFESHESSKKNFENSCPELDVLIDFARESDLCLGARLSGGGFGGVSIHLVHRKNAESYCTQIADHFKKQIGRQPRTLLCHCAAGASVHSLIPKETNK